MAYRDGLFGVCALWLLVGAGCGSTASRDTAQPPSAGEAPDRIVTGAAFTGGTRLRAVLAEASDGAAVFLHWWDSELDVACKFEPMDEPDVSWRCLPRSAPTIYEGAGEAFADSRCSQRLLRSGTMAPDGPRVVQLVDMNCWMASEYFRIGAPFTGGTSYRKTEQDCVPEAAPADGQTTLYTLERVPMQAFVAAELLASESPGPVADNYLSAEDGSRAPHGFSDLAGGFDCWPRQTSTGTRCLPIHFGWGDRGGVYADASCSAAAAWPEERCGGRRNTLPFVLFEGPSSSGGITAVHRGGARLSELFIQVGAGCSEANPETVAFAIGQPMELGSFLDASLRRVPRPSGLVQTVAQVDGSAPEAAHAVAIARFDQLATDVFGGYDCTLAVTSDGVRCVPPVEPVRADYADASCTQPVWGTEWDRMSVGSGQVEVEAPTAGRVVLPRVDRVLTGGTRYEGPVYRLRDTNCILDPAVPNARQPYHRFSGEVRLADLPALPIVVR
jgi:hypothetical protein